MNCMVAQRQLRSWTHRVGVADKDRKVVTLRKVLQQQTSARLEADEFEAKDHLQPTDDTSMARPIVANALQNESLRSFCQPL